MIDTLIFNIKTEKKEKGKMQIPFSLSY
jgi:hypothetical protein